MGKVVSVQHCQSAAVGPPQRFRTLVPEDKILADQFGPLPEGMHKRLDQLISRAKAKTLWQHLGCYQISGAVVQDLHVLSFT
jgi:hypothetical protein